MDYLHFNIKRPRGTLTLVQIAKNKEPTMSDKEKKYHRARFAYLILSVIMTVSLLCIIIGIPVIFFNHSLGATLVTYGLILSFVVSSFYFISRTRYLKAKVAFQALKLAKSKIQP